jgi:hypothetical protein
VRAYKYLFNQAEKEPNDELSKAVAAYPGFLNGCGSLSRDELPRSSLRRIDLQTAAGVGAE